MAAFFRKWGLPLLMLAAIAFFVGFGIHRRRQWSKDHVLVELKAIQTSHGWGYDILANGHPYIHQEMIPDIRGQHGFLTKEDALAVGEKVRDRLLRNQLPAINADEMRRMGIHLPDTTNPKQ